MTHRKSQTVVKKIMLGLAVGTTMMGAVAVRAESYAECFGAVIDLYVAQRASGSLNYVVCKAACRELAPEERYDCRRGCRQDRAAAVYGYRADADTLRVVCEGGAVPAERSTAGTVPSTCAPDLSECAANVRASARACDRDADLVTLGGCAADVSAAADRCAADFVDCAAPAEG